MSLKKLLLFIVLPLVIVVSVILLSLYGSGFMKFAERGSRFYRGNDMYSHSALPLEDKIQIEIDVNTITQKQCVDHDLFYVDYEGSYEKNRVDYFIISFYIVSKQIKFKEGKVIDFEKHGGNAGEMQLSAKLSANDKEIMLSWCGYGGEVAGYKNTANIAYYVKLADLENNKTGKIILSNFIENHYIKK